MRSMHKMWRNGRGGKWTCRIKWYGQGKDCQENVRLNCHCPYGELNLYPASLEEADQIWRSFRQLAEANDVDNLWTFIKRK